jgi:hypothetical protein
VKLVHGGGKIGDVLVDGASRAGHGRAPAPPPFFFDINPMQGTHVSGDKLKISDSIFEIYESLC